jgi:DNA-binding transcriptional LysR family regulator
MANLPFTLRQLEIFECLAEQRGFRRAAEELGISQASVSNQMRELESQLGTVLLSRGAGQRPCLTLEGLAFLDDLRAFKAAAAQLASHRRDSSKTTCRNRFRVLVGRGLMDRYIRPKLDEFLYRHPEIHCAFSAQLPHGAEALKMLSNGGFDCGLLHVIDGTVLDVSMQCLGRIEHGIYAHKQLIDAKNEFPDPQSLSKLPFILPPPGTSGERAALEAFAKHGIVPTNIVGRPQYYEVTASMIERGLGVAILTNAMFKPEARKDIALLYKLPDWLLVWYERTKQDDVSFQILKDFLISAVMADSDYPVLPS